MTRRRGKRRRGGWTNGLFFAGKGGRGKGGRALERGGEGGEPVANFRGRLELWQKGRRGGVVRGYVGGGLYIAAMLSANTRVRPIYPKGWGGGGGATLSSGMNSARGPLCGSQPLPPPPLSTGIRPFSTRVYWSSSALLFFFFFLRKRLFLFY